MPWIIFAVAVWLLLILFLKREDLKTFWSAGFWSFIVFLFLNEAFVTWGHYVYSELVFDLEGIPLAFLVAFAGLGIIIIRFLPTEKWWQLPYLFLFALGISILEYFALEQGYIIYLDWSLYYNLFFKLLGLVAVAWLSNLTVTRPSVYIFR